MRCVELDVKEEQVRIDVQTLQPIEELSADDLRHFPHYPVSALRIGRLAVSLKARGKGYGGTLLGFSVRQALKIRDIAGVRILLVDAKDEEAENFYKHFGFTPTSSAASMLYLVI